MDDTSAQFTHEQMAEATLLSYVAYSGFYFPMPYMVEHMVKRRLKEFAPHQELVWGPVALRSKLLDPFTVTLVYVTRDNRITEGPAQYSVVFRGTNAFSWSSWVVQDYTVYEQVPWTVASPYTVNAHNPIQCGAATISAGANVTLNKLKGIKYRRKTLLAFLQDLLQNTDATLTFTGHSLGGLSSMMFPAWLIDECTNAEVPVDGRLQIMALAAPTPGDALFAEYSNDLYDHFNCKYVRIVNPLDGANIVFSKERIAGEMPSLYMPYGLIPTKGDAALINTTYNLSVEGDYTQPDPQKTFQLPKEFLTLPNTPLFNLLKEISNWIFQDKEPPFSYLNQAMAQHIFPYILYFLDEDQSSKLARRLQPELQCLMGVRGAPAIALRNSYKQRAA